MAYLFNIDNIIKNFEGPMTRSRASIVVSRGRIRKEIKEAYDNFPNAIIYWDGSHIRIFVVVQTHWIEIELPTNYPFVEPMIWLDNSLYRLNDWAPALRATHVIRKIIARFPINRHIISI